jgi:hypothetical protein
MYQLLAASQTFFFRHFETLAAGIKRLDFEGNTYERRLRPGRTPSQSQETT